MISRRGLFAAGMAVTAGAVVTSCTPWEKAAEGEERPGGLPDGWVASWGAPAGGPEPDTSKGYPFKSIRNLLQISLGGSAVRVRMSNLYGKDPLELKHVTVAIQAEPNSPEARPESMRTATFDGAQAVVIQPGTEVWSDKVDLELPHNANLLVTTYATGGSGPVSYHPMAVQFNYMAEGKDFADDPRADRFTEQNSWWRYVTEVAVYAPQAAGAVATFGGSSTDGAGSTMGGNARWPDYLGRRLIDMAPKQQMGVYNAGVSANRLLVDSNNYGHEGAGKVGLERLQRDVIDRAGVRTLIVAHGLNDLQQPPKVPNTAQRVIEQFTRIVSRCHDNDIRVVGTTITPFKYWGTHNPETERERQEINEFVLHGGVFDAVADFDKAILDPNDPLAMRPEFDFGDHMHCNDAGYRAMADAINLERLT
ncbi:lysophospholipase L1-like esterase [Tamaricihabitans halophyticus]|uniref:Lysophospholipase L1-like esterase n=1 Tax=Tamaricihabitans halophyticus TaxID=1262583 RepID=A0A4R2RCC4_9PSEU|nr:SGNH/GDSL hydrolase family protein [Tamaricihabitans halophyticus]TCP57381.1 lysophospholipase L1-like esterase [Tamaricihabitans halophyticus]